MKRFAIFIFLLAACATKPQQPIPARLDVVPPGVLDALCARLQMDAIGTGAPLALVNTTRPLATQQTLSSLMLIAERGARTNGARLNASASDANRTLPISTEQAACRWRPLTPAQGAQLHDEMLIELSAPTSNPFAPREAGLFARASLDGGSASWYWIALVPYGDRWRVRGVSVLVQ